MIAKKIFSFFIAFFLMFSMFSSVVYAQNETGADTTDTIIDTTTEADTTEPIDTADTATDIAIEGIPQECSDAGITDPQECSEYIFDKIDKMRDMPPPGPDGAREDIIIAPPPVEGEMMMPPECQEAGITSKEECEKLMKSKYGGAGEAMMGPPPEFERPEDRPMFVPQKMMMPQPCIDAGATTPEECEKIMMSKFGPQKGMPTVEAERAYPIKEDCPAPHVGYKLEPYPGTPTSCRYMTNGCALEFETKEECLKHIKYEESEVAGIEIGAKPGDALYFADKLRNNVELVFAGGEKKAELAMKSKRERMLEVEDLVRENMDDEEFVEKHIEKVMRDIEKKEKIIEREASADLSVIIEEETKKSVETLVELKYKLPKEGWEGVENALEQQITKEKKLKLAAQITRKIDALCEELAELDYDLMLEEPRCNPSDKPGWIKDRQKELKVKDK